MKKHLTALGISALLFCSICLPAPAEAGAESNPIYEYATLRWAGRDDTHVIFPGGRVEVLGANFKGIKRPERTDERAYFMNLAVNALARQGYELVAMTPDDYVFRRVAKP